MQIAFNKNIVSHHVVKSKCDKVYKKVVRDAKKKIKNGQLYDAHSLSLFLKNIDGQYTHLLTYIRNTSHIIDYKILRREKLSEAKEKLNFFNQETKKLNELREELIIKAKDAGVTNKIRNIDVEIDISKLQKIIDNLDRVETGNGNE